MITFFKGEKLPCQNKSCKRFLYVAFALVIFALGYLFLVDQRPSMETLMYNCSMVGSDNPAIVNFFQKKCPEKLSTIYNYVSVGEGVIDVKSYLRNHPNDAIFLSRICNDGRYCITVYHQEEKLDDNFFK